MSEEQELLAELANLDREEEQLQAQQVKQIDNAYKDFIHCQNTYAEYANQFYIIHSNADSKLQNSNNESKKHKNGLIKTAVIFTCTQTIVFTTAITTQTEI